MATCAITKGVTLTCQNQRDAIGGVNARVWLGNLDEISGITTDANGYVTAINFDDYTTQGLHAFTGFKNQNSGNSDMAPTDGGNVAFTHQTILTLLDVTPEQKEVLEDLAFASVVQGLIAIVETAGQQFILYGWSFGLTIESGPKSTGQTSTDSTTRVLTLTGAQGSLEKVILDTDYATTKAYLESLEISTPV